MDITNIPIEAGTACFLNKEEIDSVPKASDLSINNFVNEFSKCKQRLNIIEKWFKQSIV